MGNLTIHEKSLDIFKIRNKMKSPGPIIEKKSIDDVRIRETKLSLCTDDRINYIEKYNEKNSN